VSLIRRRFNIGSPTFCDAAALAALATFDYFYLDGRYLHAIQLTLLSLLHSLAS